MDLRAVLARSRPRSKRSAPLFLFSVVTLACSAEIGSTGAMKGGPPDAGGPTATTGGPSSVTSGAGGVNGAGTSGAAGAAGDAIGSGGAAGAGGSMGGDGSSGATGGAGGATGGSGGTAIDGPLGAGWAEYFPTKVIHLNDDVDLQTFAWTEQKSVCNPVCADYRYDGTTDTETFRIVDNRSNRAEIRLNNEYSTGSRQFQGYVKFDAPLNDESLFQIFGSTNGATQLMVRGYSASGGSIRAAAGPVMATNVYGVEHRVNVIHRQGNDIRVYIDKNLAYSFADNEGVVNYQKYGCYGTLKTKAVTVTWRAVRFYRDGAPP